MKKSVIPIGDKVKDSTTVLTTFMLEENVKFHLKATEYKDVIYGPFKAS